MTEYGSTPIISLDGSQLSDSGAESIRSAVVESDLVSPSECRIEFSDRDGELLDELGITIGTELEVRATPVEESSSTMIFRGTVFSLAYQADSRGGYSIVVGYDDAWKLRQRRGTRSFQDSTDAKIIEAVCQDADIPLGDIDDTNVTYPYVAQLDENDWDFVARRAALSNRIVYMRDGKLQCTEPPDVSGAPSRAGDRAEARPLQLAYGSNLTELMVRQSAVSQVSGVEVRAWDPQQKALVSDRCEPMTVMAESNAKPTELAESTGGSRRVLARPALTTTAQCTDAAKAAAESHASALTYAEARATGDPRLIAGEAVSIGLAGPFDGAYVITTASHIFDGEGYFTELTVSGQHDVTAAGLARAGHRTPQGHWPALVTNVVDPDALGRVRVKFPWLDEDFKSNWARVSQIGAGKDRGVFWFPEVDDEVLVTFIDGDVSSPVIIGGLYNGQDTPPLDGFDDAQDGAIDVRCLRTRHGHTIEFRDSEGDERIAIRTGNERVSIVLEDSSSGRMTLQIDGDLAVDVSGKIAMSSGGDLELSGGGSVRIDAGANLELSGGGTVKVSGTMIDLN